MNISLIKINIVYYSIDNTCSSEKIFLDCIHYAIINDNTTTIDLYSPQLFLSSRNDLTKKFFVSKLNCLISFEELNHLTVTSNNFDRNQVTELLRFYSNSHTLTLSIYSSLLLSLYKNKNDNNIQQMIIRQHLIFGDVQQLIIKFSCLKSLEMNIKECDLELII